MVDDVLQQHEIMVISKFRETKLLYFGVVSDKIINVIANKSISTTKNLKDPVTVKVSLLLLDG